MTQEEKQAMVQGMFQGADLSGVRQIIAINEGDVCYQKFGDGNADTGTSRFPLNKSVEEGRQWYDFLVEKEFIPVETELSCWLFRMGFSTEKPSQLKPIEWLKTVETAQMMIRKVHKNLLDSKQLSVSKMCELASECFTKNGKPLKLAKSKKEFSLAADAISDFFPTTSDHH